MKTCPRCNNLAEDNAASCVHCSMVLDQSVIARATGAPRSRVPTMTEVAEPARPMPPPRIEFRPTPPPSAPIMSTAAAPVNPVPSTGRRGQTVYIPSGSQEAAISQPTPIAIAAARRVIGVLVTYSWKPDGQVFPVREGRNLIGRGEECDVRIPEDPMLSLVNTHITYRQSFTIGDMVSMGGTYLNGEAVEEQFRPLSNLGQIRAGSTQLLFVVIDPKLLGVGN